jgi:hypothetical protein
MKKEFNFIRRFLKLDKGDRIFTILKDQEITIEAKDIDSAFLQIIEKLDKEEGTIGVIPDGGRMTEPYQGLYVDRELSLPQIASMDRMCMRGDEFDYIFYPEQGRYNGENNKFLYLSGIIYKGVD